MKDLYGKCGCNCGRCPAFVANAKTLKARKKCSDGWSKYLGAKLKPSSCICLGCQSKDPWKTGNMLPDRGCNIRPCVVALGIKTCAQCAEYPCADLKARIPGKDFRKRVSKHLGRPVPEQDYLAFLEPYEGIEHLKVIRRSVKPKYIVKMPKISPLKAKAEEFPEQLVLSRAETAGSKSLHKLLKKIITAQASTYARQIIVKRRKDLILSILWIFGLYGTLKKKDDATLVITSKKDTPRDVHIIVRKKDNRIHMYAAQSFGILKGYGVHAALNSRAREWNLTLHFGKKAGGTVALKALQRYVRALVKKYGRPKYAGSSRFKGKAFEHFAKADMRLFGVRSLL